MTAIFVANDQMALGTLRALHEAGRRIPADVSVVGFDDIPEAPYFTPPLTTVRQDFDEMGRRGLRLLLERMEAPDAASAAPRSGASARGAGQHRPAGCLTEPHVNANNARVRKGRRPTCEVCWRW